LKWRIPGRRPDRRGIPLVFAQRHELTWAQR
jgi:hypothetical protein